MCWLVFTTGFFVTSLRIICSKTLEIFIDMKSLVIHSDSYWAEYCSKSRSGNSTHITCSMGDVMRFHGKDSFWEAMEGKKRNGIQGGIFRYNDNHKRKQMSERAGYLWTRLLEHEESSLHACSQWFPLMWVAQDETGQTIATAWFLHMHINKTKIENYQPVKKTWERAWQGENTICYQWLLKVSWRPAF